MSDAPRRPPQVRVYGARPRAEPGDANPLFSGVIVGVLLAVAWTFLVYVTHNPVSLAGWGVGGLIGLALAKAARATSRALGGMAAVLTVGTVVLAKALILAFALRPIIRDEVLRSPDATAALYLIDMTVRRSFSPELQAALDSQGRARPDRAPSERAFDVRDRIIAEARTRASAASRAQREQLVRMYSDSIVAREGFLPMLGRLFSFWDLLWLGLGVSSAWKLAQSGPG